MRVMLIGGGKVMIALPRLAVFHDTLVRVPATAVYRRYTGKVNYLQVQVSNTFGAEIVFGAIRQRSASHPADSSDNSSNNKVNYRTEPR